MATFQVKAPDGRTLRLTGDSAPTEAELNSIFGAEQELTPLTEEQKQFGQSEADRLAPATTIGQEALKAENIIPAAKAGLRAGARTAADAFTLGIGGGFVDEAEALGRSALSDRPREEILQEIEQERQAEPTSAKVVGGLTRLGSSIAGGGLLGKAALGAAGSLGGRAAGGGLAAFGESQGDPVATGLGAGLGVISPSLAKGATKLLPKGITNKLTATVRGNKGILDIAKSPKLTGTAAGGLEVSKSLSKKSLPLIDREIRNTSGRVQKEVLSSLGVDSVDDLTRAGKREFGNFVSKNKNKLIKKSLLTDVFLDDDIGKTAIKARLLARRQSPELRGLADNSIPVLQKTKSILGQQARKGGDLSTTANVLKNQLSDAIESGATGFKDMNRAYAKAISKQEIARKMTVLKGNVSRDFAKGLDRVEILDNVSKDFGEDVADNITRALQRESGISKNLRTLKSTAEKTTAIKSGAKKLQESLGVRNIVGATALGGAGLTGGLPAAAALGGGILGAKAGLGALATKQAGKILPVAQRELTPALKAAISAAAGRETPELLNTLIGERR